MVAFSAVNVGDILYDVRRTKMGNTTMSRLSCWGVKVLEVDVEKRRALVSWNGNRPEWWRWRRIERLRRNMPKAKA